MTPRPIRRLEPEPAYIDPVTGAVSDAALHAELLGDDVTPVAQLEAHVQRLVALGVAEDVARRAYGLPTDVPRA